MLCFVSFFTGFCSYIEWTQWEFLICSRVREQSGRIIKMAKSRRCKFTFKVEVALIKPPSNGDTDLFFEQSRSADVAHTPIMQAFSRTKKERDKEKDRERKVQRVVTETGITNKGMAIAVRKVAAALIRSHLVRRWRRQRRSSVAPIPVLAELFCTGRACLSKCKYGVFVL